MSAAVLILFNLSAFYVLYVYALYPLFLLIAGALRRRTLPKPADDVDLPSVTILIPAYNEADIIVRKVESTLALDYPAGKLRIVVVSDCSEDGTDEIVRGYEDNRLRFLRNETQSGKIATLSRLGSESDTDVIVITDANAIFDKNALRELVRRFRDPTVGLVNGNKVLKLTETMVGDGEGAYWIYETRLKQAESDVFSNAFVTGAMTAIRRDLFLPLPGQLEFDHVLPLHIVNEGYRVVFADDACFHEETAPSSGAEWNVRVRNAIRGFTMVFQMGKFLEVRRHPWYALHVYSRKVMRWLIGIPALFLLITNLALLQSPWFRLILGAQIAFYSAALVAWILDRMGRKQGILALPFYFCLVNAASLVGFWKAARGQRMAVWSTGRR
jgi:cellulose synthase/poly-beta-1,6-N-acetylglucosamine synthase-like glycosyltransferase